MMSIDHPPRASVPAILSFLLLAICTLGAILLSIRQDRAVGWVRHTLEVENRLSLIQRLVTDAETGQRGFLLSGQPSYLLPYQEAVGRLPSEIDALQAETSDNDREQQAVAALRPLVQAKLNELGDTVGLARNGRLAEAIAIMRGGIGQNYMRSIRPIIAGMVAEEDRLLSRRQADAAWLTLTGRIVLLISAALIVLMVVLVIRDATRRIAALAAANRDLIHEIAERSQAQSQVRQLQKMEAVGQLTGGIAHDFNNMLAIVIGSLDLARRRLTGSEHDRVRQCIDNATQGAERAATLTSRLLAFSRQQPLEPKVVDANKLVGGMSEMLRRTLGEEIQVESVLAGGLWKVCADQVQIESALVNLAVNARDAMPTGGKLTIETANSELDDRYASAHEEVAAGQYVVISVTDNGTGMTQSVMERAF